MSDELAQRLADLQVKRNRTLADLDAIQEAHRSIQRSLESFGPTRDETLQPLLDKLEAELPDSDRRQALKKLEAAFRELVDEFTDLTEEWSRLHVQERILLGMIVEIDRQIEDLARQMG